MSPKCPWPVLILALLFSSVLAESPIWMELEPGFDLCRVAQSPGDSPGESGILVVRIDPRRWKLQIYDHSHTDDQSNKTARQWAEDHDLVLAINAGMFATDYKTHVGYMKIGDHVNSADINHYLSLAAFQPVNTKVPPFQIFDLDWPGIDIPTILEDYQSVVQNLRLVKNPGENRWSQQDKKWSEAALGEDSEGRALFVYSRFPFSMHDLNQTLLRAGIDLVALQHLEGGPEAQLYIHLGNYQLEICGSYETDFNENNANLASWPIPFVIGVHR